MEKDAKQSSRKANFRRQHMGDLNSNIEAYASKLRKHKKDDIIQSKRMKALSAYGENSPEAEKEIAALAVFMQREPLLWDEKALPVSLKPYFNRILR